MYLNWIALWLSLCLLKIADDSSGYALEMFCIPKHYEDVLQSVLIPSGLISDRWISDVTIDAQVSRQLANLRMVQQELPKFDIWELKLF